MQRTRRALLSGVSAASVIGVAGCLGGNGGDDGDDTPEEASEYDCEEGPADPDAEYRPTIGDPDADVVVQTFEDFTCGGCAAYKLQQFPAIREAHIETGEIRYEHWDFPIPVNETWAVPVASAARGVGAREGNEAFFTFTAEIYEHHGSYSLDAIGAAAETAGADPCEAIADARERSYEEVLMSDREEGEAMGLQATPTVYVNGDPVDADVDELADAVSDAIAAAQS